jgi:hypothetical protein
MINRKNFLLLGKARPNLLIYGVVAFPKDENQTLELHGAFTNQEDARTYAFALRREYEDYRRFVVCKIELPAIGPPIVATKR